MTRRRHHACQTCAHPNPGHYCGCPRGRCTRCHKARGVLEGLCMPCFTAVQTVTPG